MENIYGTISESWLLIRPELLLLVTAVVVILVGLYVRSRYVVPGLSLVAIVIASYIWYLNVPDRFPAGWILSATLFKTDTLRWLLRGINLATGFLFLLMVWKQISEDRSSEFFACLLGIIAGTGIVIAGYDLVVLFLALETVSIPSYVALYLLRQDNSGVEATIKYFFLSIFSSAFFVFGISLLYTDVGRTNYLQIQLGLLGSQGTVFVLLSGIFILAGLSFRIAAVPFHFYAPDVFAGTHPAAAGLLAVIPKLVGFAALMQLVTDVYTAAGGQTAVGLSTLQLLMLTLGILAGASMIVGNVLGLLQNELYRLLAYSSIAHAGYMLVGLAAGNDGVPVAGYQALVFYLVAYILMSVSMFAGLLCVRQDGKLVGYIDELSGLARSQPVLAFLLAVSLFSLTGLPPTVGFWGKVGLFLAAWYAPTGQGLLRCLAILLAVNAAIGAWYYLRILGVMYLRQPVRPFDRIENRPALISCVISTALTLILFFQPALVWKPIENFNNGTSATVRTESAAH